MKNLFDFLLALVVAVGSVWAVSFFAIELFSSIYDPKDEIIMRVENSKQEAWRKQLDSARSKAVTRSVFSMSWIAVLVAFCYWIAHH